MIGMCAMTVLFSHGPSGSMEMCGHPFSLTLHVHFSAACFLIEIFPGFLFLWRHFQETPKQEGDGASGRNLLITQKIIWD